MIQIATAESVLRLDKTLLKEEAKDIQKVYIEDQFHETLLDYLDGELGSPDLREGKRKLMQVNAKFNSSSDITLFNDFSLIELDYRLRKRCKLMIHHWYFAS